MIRPRYIRPVSPKFHCRAFSTSKVQWRISSSKSMEYAGQVLSSMGLCSGDVLLFQGTVGVGKSCCIRGYIRHAMQDPKVLVPSPTYLLSQTYELPHEELSLHHMDLYRLPEFTPIEEQALGLSRACHDEICLIEWPEILLASPLWRHGLSSQVCPLFIHISYDEVETETDDDDEPRRLLQLESNHPRWQRRLQDLPKTLQ